MKPPVDPMFFERNFMRQLSLAALLSLAPALAFADNCDTGELTGFDGVYCFSKVFMGEDQRLNDNYAELRSHLNAAQRDTLRDAQLNWIEHRDSSCMPEPHTVNVDCALSVTRERADFLKARTTECTSVGCADSKLSDY